MDSTWWFPLLLVGGMVLFWGTIFGHKKQNESDRMSSRLGVADGKIWRSRMLPATLLYVPVFVCMMCFMFKSAAGAGVLDEQASMMLWIGLPAYFTLWLAPLAMGAFFSISFRNRFAAVVLTIIGTILLFVWAMCGMNWFGCFLAWTTLPICIALLVASRLRTKDYLRESYTWRSKFVSLTPVFGIMLAVLAVLPFVRIYSIPYVSWEQIETYLDQADIPERLAPDKRRALIQTIANNNTLPPEHEDFFALLFNIHKEGSFDETEMSIFDILEEYTYEEYLLLYYAYSRHVALNPLLYSDRDRCCAPPAFLERLRYTPWEAARVDRVLRLRIIGSLVESDSLQDERAKSLVDWYKKWLMPLGLDQDTVGFMQAYSSPEGQLIRMRLEPVANAVELWYRRHGTFPESLDELVDTLDDFAATQYTLLDPDDELLVNFRQSSPFVEGTLIVVTPAFGTPEWSADGTPVEIQPSATPIDMGSVSGMSDPYLPARTVDGLLAFISQDVADTVSNPRPFLDAIPIHPFTKKPVSYHHNAPPPIGVDHNTPDWRLYLTERAVGNVPTNHYVRRSHQEEEAVRKAFLKSGGTYVRLGKNVTFFVALTER